MTSAELETLINDLLTAEEGSRRLDSRVGRALGWVAHVEIDRSSSEERAYQVWLAPGSNAYERLPPFTTSMNAAHKIAQDLQPSNLGAVSWQKGGGRAVIGPDGQTVFAATAELALCVAALKLLDGGNN